MVRRPGPGPVSSQRTGYGVRERGQMMLHLGSSPGGAVGTHSTLPGLHGVSELGERPGQAEGSGTPGARAWGSVSASSLDKPAGARTGGCVLSVSGLTKQPVCPASQDSALGMPRAQPRLPVVSEATLWAHFLCAPGFARSTSCGPPGAPRSSRCYEAPFPDEESEAQSRRGSWLSQRRLKSGLGGGGPGFKFWFVRLQGPPAVR